MVRHILWTLALTFGLTGSALAADVTVTAADGTKLHAIQENAAKKGVDQCVVLVHGDKRQATDWKHLMGRLSQSGFTPIAVDLRGHGANVPAGTTPPALNETSYRAMVQDVEAAMGWCRTKGLKKIDLVGAGLGANLAVRAAAPAKDVVNLVLLSPGLAYQGVTASDVIGTYGNRPVLIVTSKDDAYSAKSSLVLEADAKGRKYMEVYQAAGSGTTMMNREPGLESLIQSWLLGTFVMDGEEESTAPTITIDENDTIETSGEKLPYH